MGEKLLYLPGDGKTVPHAQEKSHTQRTLHGSSPCTSGCLSVPSEVKVRS